MTIFLKISSPPPSECFPPQKCPLASMLISMLTSANTFRSNDNLKIRREYKTREKTSSGNVAILFYFILFYLFVLFCFSWNLVSFRRRKFTFPHFPQVFLKGILEKGVLFLPYMLKILKMNFCTDIYQRFCLDFKIVYQ